MDSKIKARHIALELRSKIAASIDVTAAADRLMEHFIAEFDIRSDLSAAAYWPFRDEIDVRPLLNAKDGMGCNCLFGTNQPQEDGCIFIGISHGTYIPWNCYNATAGNRRCPIHDVRTWYHQPSSLCCCWRFQTSLSHTRNRRYERNSTPQSMACRTHDAWMDG